MVVTEYEFYCGLREKSGPEIFWPLLRLYVVVVVVIFVVVFVVCVFWFVVFLFNYIIYSFSTFHIS